MSAIFYVEGSNYISNNNYADACAKAIDLLKEWLSPAQLAQFNEKHSFEVIGSSTKTRYCVRFATVPYNVDILDDKGVVRNSICFMPETAFVPGDIMLAQKVALEQDEKRALKIANHKRLPNQYEERRFSFSRMLDWHRW